MASNRFGTLFTYTTWGESHGKAIGVVIDGCPAGIEISSEEINSALALRAPGRSPYTSPRKEGDQAEIFSGVYEGQTTGVPISILIWNHDADSSKYTPIQNLLRPGHANYTYLEKYGIFDPKGGGRASARETAGRVAAGAIARKLLQSQGIEVLAYLQSVGAAKVVSHLEKIFTREQVLESSLFCPEEAVTLAMQIEIAAVQQAGDSIGGVVAFQATGLPVGLGDPVYEKLESKLAQAMLTIPASKAFEIGSGFESAGMLGSKHNDSFVVTEQRGIATRTNYAGGTLGGISSGMPLIGRVAFKPTSSIKLEQQTVSKAGEPAVFRLPEGSRHDPCVAIRAVPVVEAMTLLVLADALLMHRSSRR